MKLSFADDGEFWYVIDAWNSFLSPHVEFSVDCLIMNPRALILEFSEVINM